jgi:hypothetical protein
MSLFCSALECMMLSFISGVNCNAGMWFVIIAASQGICHTLYVQWATPPRSGTPALESKFWVQS